MSHLSSDLWVKVGNEITSNSNEGKLLDIKFDNALNFDMHVSKLCKKANKKFHAIGRLSNYMHQEKLSLIMKALITSLFSYCPLVWMFHTRGVNKRINKIQ